MALKLNNTRQQPITGGLIDRPAEHGGHDGTRTDPYSIWYENMLATLMVDEHPSITAITSIRYVAFGADARDEEREKLLTLMDRPRLQLTGQQLAVLRELVTNSHHIMVRARAGTGKTTLINECIAWLVLLARARGMAPPSYSALSYHQLGIEFMRDNGVEGRDIGRLIELGKSNAGGIWAMLDALGIKASPSDDQLTKARMRKLRVNLKRLLGYAKNEWRGPTEDNVKALCDRYDVTLDNGTLPQVCEALRELLVMSLDLRKWGIGFDDQLWWQAETGAQLDTAPSLVFVDEYQDTNQPQAEMVRKLIDAGSRVVVVGDERQAIFGFRGADTRAMDNGEVLLRGTDDRGLTVLPLTQTRRCSEMVVRLTQAIVPDFECLPGTAKGGLGTVQDTELIAWLKPGDVVLCRNNADLVALAYRLLSKSIPCMIKGRDIGDKLCDLVDEVNGGTPSNYGDEAAQFGTALRDWYMAKRKPLLMEGDDAERRLATLQDQYDCLNILAMEGMDAGKIKNTIRFVFGDGARNGKVTLSTGHKFKGLEVETVDNRLVLLRPDRLGMAGRNDEDTMQESNVLNVMLTRAKGGLYFVPYITKKGKEVQVPQVLEGRWMELIAETLQLKEDN
jgi:hypothetical protein